MILKYSGKKPEIAEKSFVAPTSDVIGDVVVGEESGIWFNTVVRGDINEIRIGKCTNIQDGSVLHVDDDKGLYIGDFVTVGHNAVIHACKIGDNTLIGMGAIVLSGAEIGREAQVAAGAVVTPGFKVPDGHLAMGVPARVVRKLKREEIEANIGSAKGYVELMSDYAKEKSV